MSVVVDIHTHLCIYVCACLRMYICMCVLMYQAYYIWRRIRTFHNPRIFALVGSLVVNISKFFMFLVFLCRLDLLSLQEITPSI